MSHSNILVLKRKNIEDTYGSFVTDEDEIMQNLHYCMDYVTEYDKAAYEDVLFDAFNYLETMCGKENVVKTGPLSFKLTRAGIVYYFEALRTNLLQMIRDIHQDPIDAFISNGIHGWWMVKELIESNYEGLWKFEDCCPLPLTSFLQDLYTLGKNEYELELIQAFDYHY